MPVQYAMEKVQNESFTDFITAFVKFDGCICPDKSCELLVSQSPISSNSVQGENTMKKRESLSKIKLSDSQKNKISAEIKAFYIAERGEEIGMIEQMQLIDLFEEKIAPIVYNKALDDAKQWFTQMLENADSDYYALYKNEI